MMQIPLNLSDVSLLLALLALILLMTVEIFIPFYGKTKLLVNHKMLKKIAIVSAASSLFSVVINVMFNNLVPS